MTHLGKSEDRLGKVAGELAGLLCKVIRLQRDYVARVCPACAEPCCNRVWLVFDEKDIIFAKVFLGHRVSTRGHKRKRGCPFLSATGCRLEPKSRPFTCHRSLCPRLIEEMTQREPGLPQLLNHKFRALEALRGRLWQEYLMALPEPAAPQGQKTIQISTGCQR